MINVGAVRRWRRLCSPLSGIGHRNLALQPSAHTTPAPIVLQNALHAFAAEGFAACALEASSIGIVEHRLAGTRVAVAVFTNFSQDHLDYHGDMRAYWAANGCAMNSPSSHICCG